MAQLDIKITTKYEDAVKGANKVTDSYKKLGNEMVKTSQEGKSLDDVMSRYADSLSKALINEEKTKDGMAALTSQAKILKSEMAKVGQSIGEDNALYKKMGNALKQVQQDMAKIPASTRKASSGFDDISKSSGNAVTKLLSVAKNILKFQLLMGPITAAVRGFRNTILDSLKVSAEAEQRFNKLATVFDGLADSAKSAASAIAAELGVATSTAASALSTVGDLLQAQGMGTADSLGLSSEWVKQFQDIIAFKDINMSLEEFAQNFMSGAAGNLRNFRTFGSIVKESAVNARLAAEGMDTLTGSELELAKMTTRATMALEQQANSMGATEREWDTMLSINRRLNEAWKEYKENLGDSLNRFLKPAKSWLAEILDLTNDVSRALKEIESGNFTFTVKQESGDALSKRILGVMKRLTPEGSMNQELTTGQQATVGNYLGFSQLMPMAESKNLVTAVQSWSAEQLAKVMTSLGATRADMEDAFEGVYEVADSIWVQAESLAKSYKDEADAIDKLKTSLLSSAESADAFIESMATLTGVNYQWSDYANIVKGMTFNAETLGLGTGEMDSILGLGISSAINNIFNQLAGMGSDKFANPMDLRFGVNNKAEDLQAYMDEVRKFYEILANRQKKFGDVSDYELERVMNLWKSINDELDEYNRRLKVDAALANANSTMASALNSYFRLKYENGLTGTDAENAYRMSVDWDIPLKIQDFAKALRDAKVPLEEVVKQSNEYEKILKDEAQLKLEIATKAERDALLDPYKKSAAGYRQQMANIGLSDAQITRNRLQAELQAAYDSRDRSLYYTIQDTIKAFDELQDKLKEVEIAEAWKALGDKALGSMGTVGGAIQTFRGEGDIWTKILNVCIDILSQSEEWSDVVAQIDKVIAPLLPLVEGIVNTLASLNWFWDIAITVMRVTASVVAGIMRGVEYVIDIFQWLWDNLKIALNNIFEAITHPFSGGAQQDYKKLANYWADTNKTYDEILNKIWTDMPKENDNLALLKDLYDRKIIDENQFYAGARVVQTDKVFDPVTATGYITDRQNGTVTYGNVSVTINGGDPVSVENAVYRALVKAGYPVNASIGVM